MLTAMVAGGCFGIKVINCLYLFQSAMGAEGSFWNKDY